jgi:hypothetical protein
MSVLRAADAFALHGRAAVRHAVATGRWQRPLRGVYVTHNAELTRHERWEASLAACPPAAVLGGLSALELDGLHGFDDPRCFVVLPEGADRPLLPSTVTHWSTRLADTDVHPVRAPRRTRTERSVVDAASWTEHDRHARAIVLASMQQGLVAARGMHEVLDRRATVLRAGLVRESVLDADGGIASLPEKDFDNLVLQAGIPRPTRQRVVRGPAGRYYLDAEWPELGVAVEIHGLPHQGVVQWSHDLFRANEVVIEGPRLLFFTSYVVRHEPLVVLDQLVRALRAGGWTGAARPVPVLTRDERWRQQRAAARFRDAV